MWLLPMFAAKTGVAPLTFVANTQKGIVTYDSDVWIETFQTIADLTSSGVFLAGSGEIDTPASQQLFIQGKGATYYNGSWVLPTWRSAKPSGPFDVQVTGLPLVSGASTAHPLIAYAACAIPSAAKNVSAVCEFLNYAGSPQVDKSVTAAIQQLSPIPSSNAAIKDPVLKQFAPFFANGITPLDWLWEPQVTAAVGSQVSAIMNGQTTPLKAGQAIQAVSEQLHKSGQSFYK
jgi:ABC-type glycerol-3-phosphate transport system substrate-binding protein